MGKRWTLDKKTINYLNTSKFRFNCNQSIDKVFHVKISFVQICFEFYHLFTRLLKIIKKSNIFEMFMYYFLETPGEIFMNPFSSKSI